MWDYSRPLDGLAGGGSVALALHELDRLALRLSGQPLDAADEAELAIRLAQLDRALERAVAHGADPLEVGVFVERAGAALGGIGPLVREMLDAHAAAIERRRATLETPC
jgi:hypothetical protein